MPLCFSLSSLPEILLLPFYPISPHKWCLWKITTLNYVWLSSCFHVVISLFWQDSFSEFSHIGTWSFWRSFCETLWPLPAYVFSLSCCFSLQPWLSTKAYDESLRNASFNCTACFSTNRDYDVLRVLCILMILRLWIMYSFIFFSCFPVFFLFLRDIWGDLILDGYHFLQLLRVSRNWLWIACGKLWN